MARVDASEGFSCIVLLLWPSRKHGSSSHVRYTEILGIFSVANKIQITQPDVSNAQWRKMTGLVDDTFWPLVAMSKKKESNGLRFPMHFSLNYLCIQSGAVFFFLRKKTT